MDICRVGDREAFLAAFAAGIRSEQQALLAETARDRPAPIGAAAVLGFFLPAVCIVGLSRGAYLWVAATLLFSMAYPLMLWLPTLGRRRRPAGERSYLGTLWSVGILGPGRRLGYLAGNAFVINARAVAPAFAWFAAVNLLVALGWVNDPPPLRGLGLVITAQSVFALGYNLAVWRLTPGVGSLRARTAAVRARFVAHPELGWTVLALLVIPIALAALALVPVLVLPGPSVLRVLDLGGLSPLAQALEFCLLLLGLYAVTRTVQSSESRRMARQVAEAIVRYTETEVAPRLEGTPAVMDCEAYRELATGLLEARVYRFARSTAFGRLPIYALSPDLTLVSDPETLATLRGHLDLGE